MSLQIVFQDPLAQPRSAAFRIGDSITEPLQVFQPGLSREQRQETAANMMQACGLAPELVNRYPHELSGGQNQRVGIAQAT